MSKLESLNLGKLYVRQATEKFLVMVGVLMLGGEIPRLQLVSQQRSATMQQSHPRRVEEFSSFYQTSYLLGGVIRYES